MCGRPLFHIFESIFLCLLLTSAAGGCSVIIIILLVNLLLDNSHMNMEQAEECCPLSSLSVNVLRISSFCVVNTIPHSSRYSHFLLGFFPICNATNVNITRPIVCVSIALSS